MGLSDRHRTGGAPLADLQDSPVTPGQSLRLWIVTLTPITVALLGLVTAFVTR